MATLTMLVTTHQRRSRFGQSGCKFWQRQGLAVYAYFNNDAGGMAVRNALTLKQLLGQGS